MSRKAVREMSGMEIVGCIKEGLLQGATMEVTIPMTLESFKHGQASFSVEAGDQHLNPMGGVHGGFAATVLDSATGCAVNTVLEPGEGFATVDLNIKMLRPVPKGKRLTAVGKVIHKGQSIGASEGSIRDDDGNIYAHATATCMIFRN